MNGYLDFEEEEKEQRIREAIIAEETAAIAELREKGRLWPRNSERLVIHTEAEAFAYAGGCAAIEKLKIPDWFEVISNIKWQDPTIKFTRQNGKGGYPYYALLTHFPLRLGSGPTQVEKARKLVYGFKDGKHSINVGISIANAISNTLKEEISRWTEANTVFVTIPASTENKTIARFKQFSETVSGLLGIKNGYGAIKVVDDREPLKGSVNKDKISNLDYDQAMIDRKHVILFDDVINTGSSFIQNAEMLMNLGAVRVTGVFLGENYNDWKNGFPNW